MNIGALVNLPKPNIKQKIEILQKELIKKYFPRCFLN